MGRTVTLWAMEGHRINPTEARRFYEEAVLNGRKMAETLLEKIKRDDPKKLPAPQNVNGTELVVQPKQSWWEQLKARFRRQPKAEITLTTEGETPKRWWQKLPFFKR